MAGAGITTSRVSKARILIASSAAAPVNAARAFRAVVKFPVPPSTSPIIQGPTIPPTCASVLTSAIDTAAAAPVVIEALRLQNSELPEFTPTLATQSSIYAQIGCDEKAHAAKPA